MTRAASLGLLGRILLILIAVMATEFAANTFFFDRISQFALRGDEVDRMAEHLVVARRLMDKAEPSERAALAGELSTERFSIKWAPDKGAGPVSFGLENLRAQILEVEPGLATAKLRLHLLPLSKGGNIAGTMMLGDGTAVSFLTFQGREIWSLTFSRIISLLAPTLVLVVMGGLLIRHTLKPLRVLMRETGRIGTDEHEPVPEEGPTEIRKLIHAFNAMQLRIQRLINGRTQALAAVGHDLRTPLARLRLRLDGADIDGATREAMERDMEEMNGLLHSLQVYLSGEGRDMPAERIDIAAMAMTLIDDACDAGGDAVYIGPDRLEMVARPVAIRRALANLIDNALHYGGNARLRLDLIENGQALEIVVEDDGPGIAEDRIDQVVQPFVRLDGARTRNTRGMGLGLAIVADAVRLEKGKLVLANRKDGGLRVTITLPLERG